MVSAVNMDTITPMPSVVAKPTIVPVPRKNSTPHAIRVVMLESRNCGERTLEAGVNGALDGLAGSHFLLDALEDE